MVSFFSGCIVGIIILQSAILAPTLFKTLEMKDAGALLRALFPKFFFLLIVLGIALSAATFFEEVKTFWHYLVCVITVLFPLICRLIIPATNKARDDGDDKRFHFLHKVSVILTVSVLLANIIVPVLIS